MSRKRTGRARSSVRKNESLDERRPRQLSKALWLHRRVVEPSAASFRSAAELLKPYSTVKLGEYTLTLLYQSEILRVSRLSRLGYISDQRLSDAMQEFLPPSLKDPMRVSVEGLGQYGNWIGATVTSPQLDAEREAIVSGLTTVFGVTCELDAEPHISIAEGRLSRVKNQASVLAVFGDEIEMSVAHGIFVDNGKTN